jgi:hypothetical protein
MHWCTGVRFSYGCDCRNKAAAAHIGCVNIGRVSQQLMVAATYTLLLQLPGTCLYQWCMHAEFSICTATAVSTDGASAVVLLLLPCSQLLLLLLLLC